MLHAQICDAVIIFVIADCLTNEKQSNLDLFQFGYHCQTKAMDTKASASV